mmetsp:Transcript_1431/g.1301  ORF Transcript_1431/g.1301 Transcript_1431/m.1301 type:complete len:98 (-) Transcript_1431:250-543(-)
MEHIGYIQYTKNFTNIILLNKESELLLTIEDGKRIDRLNLKGSILEMCCRCFTSFFQPGEFLDDGKPNNKVYIVEKKDEEESKKTMIGYYEISNGHL